MCTYAFFKWLSMYTLLKWLVTGRIGLPNPEGTDPQSAAGLFRQGMKADRVTWQSSSHLEKCAAAARKECLFGGQHKTSAWEDIVHAPVASSPADDEMIL